MLLLSPKNGQTFDFGFIYINADTNFYTVKEALVIFSCISLDML